MSGQSVWLARAWEVQCANVGEKLVLLALADGADERGRVRVDPTVLAPMASLSVSRVEGALAALDRSGLIDARRWEDSGAWSVRLTLGGVRA